jgi:phage gpG-like protein
LDILKLSGALLRSLNYNAFPDRAEISMGATGKSMVYARVHQYGYKGIPARPVLGVSAADNELILEIVDRYFQNASEIFKLPPS